MLIGEKNVVGRKPAPLKNLQTGDVQRLIMCQSKWPQCVLVLSSRRKILPTLDLGNSSLNSMYLGRL